MTLSDYVLLELLNNALVTVKKKDDLNLSPEVWNQVLQKAEEQQILPLILDTCICMPSTKSLGKEILHEWQQKALSIATRQIVQTNEFLNLILHAQEHNLNPVVLKGIICRNLYPKPMLRPSVDEDLLIDIKQLKDYHDFFVSENLIKDNPTDDIYQVDEISYHRNNSPTYIEIHKQLFPNSSDAYSVLNGLFINVMDNTVLVRIEDVYLRSLNYNDHFLYLLCHAYKHFLHGGFGIRYIADLALFANTYGKTIEWGMIFESCCKIHIELFVAALLQIAKQYLTLTHIPSPFSDIKIDYRPLLDDIMSGGLYGTLDIDRIHSSNMTLDAVVSNLKGSKSKGIIKSIFPGKQYLQNQYTYSKKYPILIPLAWAERILKYIYKNGVMSSSTKRTIAVGHSRIKLLEMYGILNHKSM